MKKKESKQRKQKKKAKRYNQLQEKIIEKKIKVKVCLRVLLHLVPRAVVSCVQWRVPTVGGYRWLCVLSYTELGIHLPVDQLTSRRSLKVLCVSLPVCLSVLFRKVPIGTSRTIKLLLYLLRGRGPPHPRRSLSVCVFFCLSVCVKDH